MVNWIDYRNEHGVDSDDSFDSGVDLASKQSVGFHKRRDAAQYHEALEDEAIEAHLAVIDA